MENTVEVFSAGCQVCDEAVALVKRVAAGTCEVKVHKMQDIEVAKKAEALGITSLPAVVINGKLAECCSGRGVDEAVLRVAGLGRS